MRIERESILANKTRRRVVERLEPRPGASVGALARELGVHYKTALHHVRVLERRGILVTLRASGRRLCYLAGQAPRAPPPSRGPLALAAVEAGAGTAARLGRALGIPRGTAGGLLVSLAARGLLAREGGRYVRAPGAERASIGPAAGQRFS